MQLPRRTAARLLVAILLLSTISPASVSAETAFSLQAVRYNLTYIAGQLALFFSDLADAIASHIPGTSLTASAAAPIPSPIAPPAPAPDFLATTTPGVSTPPTTPSASDAPPTTIIQQPVIERIVERTVPAPAASGISEQTLASRLASLKDDLLLRIAAVASAPIVFSGSAPTTPVSTATFAPSQRIDQLTNTAINTPTITGGTISSATVSGTLSGTFSGTVSSLTMSIPWGLIATDGAGNFLATSTPTVASIVATSTTATSTFAGGLTAANGGFNILQNGNAGIGTTTPNVQLHLNKSTGGELQFTRTTGGSTVHTLGFIQFGNTDVDTSLASIVASQDGATDAGRLFFQTQATDGSLATAMTILSNGNVGIGTTTPWGKLSIKGSGTGTGLAFAVTDSANTPRFVIQDNGNVGIGTTSPTSKLYIDSGAGGFGGNPTAVIQGGGDAPTSVQLLLRNTREGGGTGNDYENEVHLRLQAGSTQDHRAYINFADYTGTDQWLTGRNASNTWILFSNTSGHRMRMFDDGVSGRTELASTGAYPVMINPSETGTSHGTGGFEVYGGGPSPAPLMFDVAPYTNDQVAVSSFNNGSGYAPASLRLEAQQAASRGQGIFHYNTVSDTSWFTGVPYNTAGAKWMVGYESNATWDPAVAQTSNALFTIQNNGSVGIGTTTPWGKLSITGSGTGTGLAFAVADSANTPRFVIQDNGNVGIGTTSPQNQLHIVDVNAGNQGMRIEGNGGNWFDLGRDYSTGRFIINGSQVGTHLFDLQQNGTSRLYVNSSGNVGIGTTTPSRVLTAFSSTAPQLSLSAGAGSNEWTFRNAGGVLYIATSTYSATSSVSAFTLDANGNLTIVGSATTCTIGNGTSATSCSSSDERLKDDVTPLATESGLAAIQALNPVSFHWNSWMQSAGNASSTQFGLIAQQVQSVFPNLVQEDANTHYYKLDYQGLIAPMIKAIQEIASISGAFKTNLVAWLGSASNGIGDLFAKDIYATNGTFNRVTAQALCAEDICVTRDQLAAVLALIGQTSGSPSANAPEGTPQAPVIELNGNASSTIELGDTYNDLGARIVAPESDLNLGLVIVLDSATTTAVSIDTTIPSEHTILYTVTSPTTGLTGSIMRTVIVSPSAQSPAPPSPEPANDNPFNAAPANDNASSIPAASAL